MTSHRERLPENRHGKTHKFVIKYQGENGIMNQLEGFLTANMYEDGRVGELFIVVDKEGSMVGGLCDQIGMLVSLCLQSGVDLEKICEKLAYTRYYPSGFTTNKNIPIAKSLTDYIAQWLGHEFLEWERKEIEEPCPT